MAFSFHGDSDKYYNIQVENAKKNLIPYIEDAFAKGFKGRVLEIGCDLGGNLFPFIELGWSAVGIDLDVNSIKNASKIADEKGLSSKVQFLAKNIFDINGEDEGFTFDLVILKDVIEHVENQEDFVRQLTSFLKPKGKLLIAFPPWQMPFGGHQQGAKSLILSRAAFLHLLPMSVYLLIFKFFGESLDFISFMKETKLRGITIEQFRKIVRNLNLSTLREDFFFVAPIYEIKFGLKPRKLWGFLAKIPWFRNFYTTSIHYILEKK